MINDKSSLLKVLEKKEEISLKHLNLLKKANEVYQYENKLNSILEVLGVEASNVLFKIQEELKSVLRLALLTRKVPLNIEKIRNQLKIK